MPSMMQRPNFFFTNVCIEQNKNHHEIVLNTWISLKWHKQWCFLTTKKYFRPLSPCDLKMREKNSVKQSIQKTLKIKTENGIVTPKPILTNFFVYLIVPVLAFVYSRQKYHLLSFQLPFLRAVNNHVHKEFDRTHTIYRFNLPFFNKAHTMCAHIIRLRCDVNSLIMFVFCIFVFKQKKILGFKFINSVILRYSGYM